MKKLIILPLLFFSLSALHSTERNIGISLGYVGIGYNAGSNNHDGYFFGQIFNFWWQSRGGFGIAASPLNFLIHFNNSEHDRLTFVNASLFYNVMEEADREFGAIGPFISVHAVDINNPGFFEFRTGLNFTFREIFAESSMLYSDLFVFEFGYKFNRTNRHGLYVHFGVDLLAILFLVNMLGPTEQSANTQKSHLRH